MVMIIIDICFALRFLLVLRTLWCMLKIKKILSDEKFVLKCRYTVYERLPLRFISPAFILYIFSSIAVIKTYKILKKEYGTAVDLEREVRGLQDRYECVIKN